MVPTGYAQVSGARKITAAMVRARSDVEALPLRPVSPADLHRGLRQGRPVLGLTCQQLELLCYLIAFTDAADWSGEDDALPVATASNLDIQQRFDLGRTRVKTLLRELAEAGWILHRDSANGHRYRRSSAHGPRGQQAYGFDLSPLARRFDEISRAAQTALWRQQEGRRLHREAMSLARTVYGLAQPALEAGLAEKTISDATRRAAALIARRGQERDPAWLDPLCQELRRIALDLEQGIALSRRAHPSDDEPALEKSVESDPVGSPERPHYTNTNLSSSAKATVAASGSAGTGNEASRSRSSVVSHAPSKQPDPTGRPDVLRGFRANPSFVLHIAPALREFCSSDRPSEAEIVQAALFACQGLGISRHAWAQGQSVFGDYPNAVVIAAISARSDAGEVRSPGGMLRAMIGRHLAGTLALDRTLYGLAEKHSGGPGRVQ
ncbi:replication protein C [Acetobacter sacchari]|uniref:Replication protein C n=1 Tax=Acetobacter sacchari TaxID=2661687 RepID=A0ABS3LWC0_9PROT|nr:plasmid replication protein RepC [Acetobacter sacchari]MBO1360188.1 replication protein C [Acetobacter sacchari]